MLHQDKKDCSELAKNTGHQISMALTLKPVLMINLSLILFLSFIFLNIEFRPEIDAVNRKFLAKAPNFYGTSNSSFSALSPHSGTLEVQGRNLYYHGRKIFLVGVSRREALRRDWYDFGLKKYENEIIKYKLNYERIDAVSNYKKLRKHCQKMKKHGIIVELTLYDSGQGGFLANIDQVIKATGDLGNIIYEPVNELYSDEDVRVAKKLTHYLTKKGFLVSAGAYGAGGQKWSEKFDPISSPNQIISVHRPWTKESILKYLAARKPVIRNEYFDRGELGLTGVIKIMMESFEAGAAGVNYYGFRMNELEDLSRLDPEPYWKYLKFASLFSRKLHKRKIT